MPIGSTMNEDGTAKEQQYETKERSRTTHTGIKFDTSSHAIPPQQKEALREQELTLYKSDNKFLDWKRTRNELEGYAYELKEKLSEGGKFRDFMEPTKRDELLAKIAVCVEWIYGAGEQALIAEYETQLSDYKTLGQPASWRAQFYETLPDQHRTFAALRVTIESKLSSPNVSHLTDEQIQSVHNKLDFCAKYLEKVEADLAA